MFVAHLGVLCGGISLCNIGQFYLTLGSNGNFLNTGHLLYFNFQEKMIYLSRKIVRNRKGDWSLGLIYETSKEKGDTKDLNNLSLKEAEIIKSCFIEMFKENSILH